MPNPHPDRAKLATRLTTVGKSFDVAFDGSMYRFINPVYSNAADIVSGAGALYASGRWHLKGMARLSYAALAPETALAEVLAHVRYYALPVTQAMPTVLVALRLKVRRVLDLRDGDVRRHLRLSETTIRTLDWRAENQRKGEAISQAWGRAIAMAGFEAVITPSSADRSGANVLIFPENLLPGSSFVVENEVKWPGK